MSQKRELFRIVDTAWIGRHLRHSPCLIIALSVEMISKRLFLVGQKNDFRATLASGKPMPMRKSRTAPYPMCGETRASDAPLFSAAFLSRYLFDLTADGVPEPSASSDAPSSDTRVHMWSNRVARRRWPSDPAQVSALASRAARRSASGSWSSAWGARAASTPSRSSMAVSAGIGCCGITFAVESTTLCQPSLGSLLIWQLECGRGDERDEGVRASVGRVDAEHREVVGLPPIVGFDGERERPALDVGTAERRRQIDHVHGSHEWGRRLGRSTSWPTATARAIAENAAI